jgi:hypothetical protein
MQRHLQLLQPLHAAKICIRASAALHGLVGSSQADVADLQLSAAAAEQDAAAVLTASAAAPRHAGAQQQQEPASTSGRGAASAPAPPPAPLARVEAAAASAARGALGAAAAALPDPPLQTADVGLLPERDYGNLRGGQYPFLFDPVYGLPIVREVVRYGELLRDVRMGEVSGGPGRRGASARGLRGQQSWASPTRACANRQLQGSRAARRPAVPCARQAGEGSFRSARRAAGDAALPSNPSQQRARAPTTSPLARSARCCGFLTRPAWTRSTSTAAAWCGTVTGA